MRTRLPIISALVALALFTAAACGGGDDEGGSDNGGIEVAAVDFEFRPDAYTVSAGAEVEIALDNAGTLEHNWVVLAEPIRSESELTESNILFKLSAAPAETTRGSFVPPPPGEYQVICDIPGHLAAGMEAELTVTG